MFRSLVWGLTASAMLLGAGLVGDTSEAQARAKTYLVCKPVCCCDCCDCCVTYEKCVVTMRRGQLRRAVRRGEICCPVEVNPCCPVKVDPCCCTCPVCP